MSDCSPLFFAIKPVEHPGRQLACEWQWIEAFGESLPYTNYLLAPFVVFLYIPIAFLSIL